MKSRSCTRAPYDICHKPPSSGGSTISWRTPTPIKKASSNPDSDQGVLPGDYPGMGGGEVRISAQPPILMAFRTAEAAQTSAWRWAAMANSMS